MKISDLKTGMTVTCRNGRRYIVLRDTFLAGEQNDILWRPGGFWMALSEYDDDFNVKPDEDDLFDVDPAAQEATDREFDIVEVQRAEGAAFIGRKDGLYSKTIWRRD